MAGPWRIPVALDMSDNLPVIVADLQAPSVARIINVSDFLPVSVHDVGARRNRGRLGAIVLKLDAPRDGGGGDQDHGQDGSQGSSHFIRSCSL